MSKTQPVSESIPEFALKGMKYPVGADIPGVGMQQKKITLSGSPFSVDFAAQGLAPMADTSYCVLVGGETAAVVKVDESTMTVSGFDLLGGAAAEVAHVVVVGRIKGMMDKNGVV
jgi:hypothetical protein